MELLKNSEWDTECDGRGCTHTPSKTHFDEEYLNDEGCNFRRNLPVYFDTTILLKQCGSSTMELSSSTIQGCTNIDDFAEKFKQKFNTNCQASVFTSLWTTKHAALGLQSKTCSKLMP
jgi:hypothetical protein